MKRFSSLVLLVAVCIAVLPACLQPGKAFAATPQVTFGMYQNGQVTAVDSIDLGTYTFDQLQDMQTSIGGVYGLAGPEIALQNTGGTAVTLYENTWYFHFYMNMGFPDTLNGELFMATKENNSRENTVLNPGDMTYVYSTVFNFPQVAAGTYCGELVVLLEDTNTYVNGGTTEIVTVDLDGDALDEPLLKVAIPFSITVTGTNPELGGPVQNLVAEAGNGQVSLSWDNPSTGQSDCEIWRRVGAESATTRADIDFSAYEQIEYSVYCTSTGGTFVDATVENGTTYSYIVTTGGYHMGQCAMPVVATPSANATTRPLPPVEVSAHTGDDPLTFRVSWCLDADPNEGTEYGYTTGNGKIDYFNVYVDGVLTQRIQQSAIKEITGNYGGFYGYKWECIVPVQHANQDYTITVTAVDFNGLESFPSEPDTNSAWGEVDSIDWYKIELNAEWNDGADEPQDVVKVYAQTLSSTMVHVYRDGVSLGIIGMREGWRNNYFADKTAQRGQTYTYTLICTDGVDDIGSPINLTVTIPANSDDYDTLVESIDLTGSNYNGTVYLEFFAYEGDAYRVLRNGEVINSFTGTGDTTYIQDTPEQNGSYTYTVEHIVGSTVATATYYYEKRPAATQFGEVPSAPTLTARTTSTGKVVLNWEEPLLGGNVDGYYVFSEDNADALPHYWALQFTDRFDASVLSHSYGLWWDHLTNDGNPFTISFYVCAFNEWGMSKPSQIYTFTATSDGQAPVEAATAKPRAPIVNTTIQRNGSAYNDRILLDIQRAELGGEPYTYTIKCTTPDGSVDFESEFDWNEVRPYAYWGMHYYGEGTYTFAVTATNSRGTSAATTVQVNYTLGPTLEVIGGTQVATLNWTVPTGFTCSGFDIYRKSEYGLWENIGSVARNIRTYTDTDVHSKWTYEYYVVAKRNAGNIESNTVTTCINGNNEPLSAPTLYAKSTSEGIVLNWDAPQQGTPEYGYWLCMRDITNGESWPSGSPEDWVGSTWVHQLDEDDTFDIYDTQYLWGQSILGHTLEFRLVPQNAAGKGPSSNTVRVTMPTIIQYPADVPESVMPRITSTTADITLTWNQSTNGDYPPATYYRIERDWVDNNGSRHVDVYNTVATDDATMTWVDTNCEYGILYTYEVYATNARGTAYNNGLYFVKGKLLVDPNDPAVAAVQQLIMNNLPADMSSLTLEDEALVKEIQAAFDNLSLAHQKLVSMAAQNRLKDAQDRLKELKSGVARAHASADVYAAAGYYLVKYVPAEEITSGCATCNGVDMLWLTSNNCWALVTATCPDLNTCFGENALGAKVEATTTVAGDINCNGSLNIADVVTAYSLATQGGHLNEQVLWLLADFNNDAYVDAVDAYRLLYACVNN